MQSGTSLVNSKFNLGGHIERGVSKVSSTSKRPEVSLLLKMMLVGLVFATIIIALILFPV